MKISRDARIAATGLMQRATPARTAIGLQAVTLETDNRRGARQRRYHDRDKSNYLCWGTYNCRGNNLVGSLEWCEMVRIIIFIILLYAAVSPAVENYRLREQVRVLDSLVVMAYTPVKTLPKGIMRKR